MMHGRGTEREAESEVLRSWQTCGPAIDGPAAAAAAAAVPRWIGGPSCNRGACVQAAGRCSAVADPALQVCTNTLLPAP
jgi:hypothetical protein